MLGHSLAAMAPGWLEINYPFVYEVDGIRCSAVVVFFSCCFHTSNNDGIVLQHSAGCILMNQFCYMEKILQNKAEISVYS